MFSATRPAMLVSAMLPALFATTVVNAEAPNTYQMSAYSDALGGRELLAGRYDDAIAAAASARSRNTEEKLMNATTLCVAYTATGDFASAEGACIQAVRRARELDAAPGTLIRSQSETARAVSNLRVLKARSSHAVATDQQLARTSRLRISEAATALNDARPDATVRRQPKPRTD